MDSSPGLEEGTFTVRPFPEYFLLALCMRAIFPYHPQHILELLKNIVIRDDILNIYLKKYQLVTLTDGFANDWEN